MIGSILSGLLRGAGGSMIQSATSRAARGVAAGGNPIGPLGSANNPGGGGSQSVDRQMQVGQGLTKLADVVKDVSSGINNIAARIQQIATANIQRAGELSRYDGNMAATVAIRRRGEVDDDIRQSERTSASSKELEKSQEQWRRGTTETRAAATNLRNIAASQFTKLGAGFSETFIEPVAGMFNGKPEARSQNPLEAYIGKIVAEGGHATPKNPPAKR